MPEDIEAPAPIDPKKLEASLYHLHHVPAWGGQIQLRTMAAPDLLEFLPIAEDLEINDPENPDRDPTLPEQQAMMRAAAWGLSKMWVGPDGRLIYDNDASRAGPLAALLTQVFAAEDGPEQFAGIVGAIVEANGLEPKKKDGGS